MKIGTYFAYWEKEWDTDFFPYISKVARLGFDILEIAGGGLADLPDDQVIRLRDEASRCNITLTVCIGLPAQYDVSSENEETRQAGIAYMKRLIDKTNLVGARQIGGIVYAYWPVDYSKPVNKAATREISIRSIQNWLITPFPKTLP